MSRIAALLLVAALLPASVLAQQNYSFVEGMVAVYDPDDGKSGDGVSARFGAELGSSFHLYGEFTTVDFEEEAHHAKADTVEFEGVDLDVTILNLGYHRPLSKTLDVFGRVGYFKEEETFEDGSEHSEDGVLLEIGLRGEPTHNFGWQLRARSFDAPGSPWAAVGLLERRISGPWWGVVEAEIGKNSAFGYLGVTYFFGGDEHHEPDHAEDHHSDHDSGHH